MAKRAFKLPLAPIAETQIMREQLAALSAEFHPNGIFWRQQVGEAWTGDAVRITKPTTVPPGAVVIYHPRRITFGVPGQSDVMGCLDGQFVSIESKTATGAQRQSQINWETAVVKAGGKYAVARSADEAVEFLRRTVRGK